MNSPARAPLAAQASSVLAEGRADSHINEVGVVGAPRPSRSERRMDWNTQRWEKVRHKQHLSRMRQASLRQHHTAAEAGPSDHNDWQRRQGPGGNFEYGRSQDYAGGQARGRQQSHPQPQSYANAYANAGNSVDRRRTASNQTAGQSSVRRPAGTQGVQATPMQHGHGPRVNVPGVHNSSRVPTGRHNASNRAAPREPPPDAAPRIVIPSHDNAPNNDKAPIYNLAHRRGISTHEAQLLQTYPVDWDTETEINPRRREWYSLDDCCLGFVRVDADEIDLISEEVLKKRQALVARFERAGPEGLVLVPPLRSQTLPPHFKCPSLVSDSEVSSITAIDEPQEVERGERIHAEALDIVQGLNRFLLDAHGVLRYDEHA